MISIKKILFAAALAAFFLGGCVKKQPASDLPVFRVEDNTLTAGEFAHQLARRLKNFDAIAAKDPANVERAKKEVLRDFLIQSLIEHACEQKGLVVGKDALDAEIKREQSLYPNDLTFKSALADQNVTYEEWKTAIHNQLLEKTFFEDFRKSLPQPTGEQIKSYYEAHRASFFKAPQVHIQQILVGKQEEAELLKKEVRIGKKFADLARKFSLSPDAARGGDVGFVAKGVVPIFDKAFELKPGEVSQVLKSNYGYHLIKLLEKRPASSVSYAEASAEIRLKLLADAEQKAFTDWLEKALQTAHVEKNEALIGRIQIQTQGAPE